MVRPSCWFCEHAFASEPHALRTSLWRDPVAAPGNQVTFRKAEVLVPRCPACARTHGFALFVMVMVFLAGGVLTYLAIAQRLSSALGFGVLGWGLMIGFGAVCGYVAVFLATPLNQAMHRGRRAQEQGKEYPEVRQLVEEGWTIGLKPQKGDLAKR